MPLKTRSLKAAAYLNLIIMQQQKQVITYWFSANIFGAPVCVKINMAQRNEAQAKQLFEEMLQPCSCQVIEKPIAGKYLLINEVWEL